MLPGRNLKHQLQGASRRTQTLNEKREAQTHGFGFRVLGFGFRACPSALGFRIVGFRVFRVGARAPLHSCWRHPEEASYGTVEIDGKLYERWNGLR